MATKVVNFTGFTLLKRYSYVNITFDDVTFDCYVRVGVWYFLYSTSCFPITDLLTDLHNAKQLFSKVAYNIYRSGHNKIFQQENNKPKQEAISSISFRNLSSLLLAT